MSFEILLAEIVAVLGFVTVLATICHALRLPTVIGFILAGVAVGPSGLALIESVPDANLVAEIASIFLMFSIGLEFSFSRLMQMRRALLGMGLIQVVVTVLATATILGLWRGLPVRVGLFWGFLAALSSTAMVLKLMNDASDLETPHGRNILGILLLQDLAFIPMILLLPLLAGQHLTAVGALVRLDLWSMARIVGLLIAVPTGIWVVARWVFPAVLERVVATRSREVFYFSVLFLCLGTAWSFYKGGLSLSLGAFAAGLIISESPYSRQVTADIVPLRDAFLGLFFASVGMLVDARFFATHAAAILPLAAAVVAVKCGCIMTVGWFNRQPTSVALLMGMTLAQIGEFSFLLAARGLDLGIIGRADHQWFLCVAVLTMAMTPFAYRLAPTLLARSRAGLWSLTGGTAAAAAVRQTLTVHPDASGQAADAGVALVIGFGITGQHVVAALDSLGIPWLVIDLNHKVIKSLLRRGKRALFGDASRAEVLQHAGIESARLVVIAVPGVEIIPNVVAAVRALRPDVQIIVRTQNVRDVARIPKEPQTDIVIGEIETGIEILARVLRVYGVPPEEIRQYMEQARTALTTHAQLAGRLRSPTLTLPSWEALAAIRPFRLSTACRSAIGRSLGQLDLRRQTGASVVSVYREGLGTTIPDGDFRLAAGDILHLIGTAEAHSSAIALLSGTPAPEK